MALTDVVELTILMPCLNEAETIQTCVDKAMGYLKRSGVKGEVLIADNGSTDGSQKLAEARGARVVQVPEKGYGAALRGGIAAARGRYVIMGDADDSYDFSRLDAFVERLRDGADLVMGNRFRGGIEKGAMPFLHKYLGNPVLSFLGRLFFRAKVGDFHCGLRGFNRQRMLDLDLYTTGMEFASEMVIRSAIAGYRIDEAPTTLRPDGRSRPPHLRTWRDGWRHLRFLLMFSPRWLFLYPGFALFAFGLFTAGVLLPGPVAFGDGVVFDTHTFVASSISILIGLQIMSFGFIARRYASARGLLPQRERYSGLFSGVTLEKALIVAGLIFVAGLGGLVWSVGAWASVSFGPLEYPLVMRVLVLSLTGIAAGAQIAFTAFLASVMELPTARRLSPVGATDVELVRG